MTPGSSNPSPLRGWRASALLLRKELREASRDRALLAQLILVPLFLYPLLGMVGYQIYLVSRGVSEERSTTVWVDEELPAAVRDSLEARPRWSVTPVPPEVDGVGDRSPRVAMLTAEPAPDAWLQWREAGAVDTVIIHYDASSEHGRRTQRAVASVVRDYAEAERIHRAAELGWDESALQRYVIQRHEVSSGSEFAGWILSLVLPVVLLIMLPQGAYYATLDTIVAERERGTWETLLTSPLDHGEIVVGKFAYVVLWSLAATVLNLMGMLVFLWAGAQILGLGSAVSLAWNLPAFLVSVAAMVLFAIAVAAVMILVALPARSYREGQAALSPVYLVSAVGAMLSVTGGESFGLTQALLPVLNVAGLLRSALRGDLSAGPVGVALLSLTVLAAVSVALSRRVLRDQQVYFEASPSLRAIFRRRS